MAKSCRLVGTECNQSQSKTPSGRSISGRRSEYGASDCLHLCVVVFFKNIRIFFGECSQLNSAEDECTSICTLSRAVIRFFPATARQ
jgi:hypothetical protein